MDSHQVVKVGTIEYESGISPAFILVVSLKGDWNVIPIPRKYSASTSISLFEWKKPNWLNSISR